MTKLSTPWGAADGIENVAPGIVFVTTSSHGGFKVEPAQNAKIPHAWRLASFNNSQGLRGWYEEDCDWCMVALTFPEAFNERQRNAARQTFDAFIAPKLAA